MPDAYDENGWPSGFAGGKLLRDIENHDRYLTYKIGEYDKDTLVFYDISGDELVRITKLISLFFEKVLTNAKKIDIIIRQVTKRRSVTEKYSSGRRGAPAKGVGRVFPARESKSLLLRQ